MTVTPEPDRPPAMSIGHGDLPDLPDDGVLLEARADPTPVLLALGTLLVALAALVLSIIAIVD